jgi:hypothetical protein
MDKQHQIDFTDAFVLKTTGSGLYTNMALTEASLTGVMWLKGFTAVSLVTAYCVT